MTHPQDPDDAKPGGGFLGLERLGQKAAVVLGSNGIGALLGFAALLAIGRYYAPGAYGAYLFAVSLVGVTSTLFALGFNVAHQREVALGVPVDRALGVFVRIRLVLVVLQVAVVLGALWVWTAVFGKGFTDATSFEVVLIILASSVLVHVRKLATDTWIAQGRVHRAEWSNFADSVVYSGTVVLVGFGLGAASGRWIPLPWLGSAVAELLNLSPDLGVLDLALYVTLGHFLGKVAGIALTAFWWLQDRTHVGPWDPSLAHRYRRFALPIALTGMLALVLQHTDVLMIGFFWTTREVGWYGAAQKIANVALLANIALRGILMPYFASLFGRGEGARAIRAFRQVERLLLMAVVPLAIAMMVWAREGLHIFVGDSFLGSAPALRWLAAWTLVSALSMPLGAQHMGAGETRVLVQATIVNVAANVTLNLLLIPESLLGIPLAGMAHEGAAVATFCSSLLAYGWNRVAALRLYGIPLFDRAQAVMAATGILPGILWLWMRAALPATAYDRIWELVPIGAVGVALYLVVLWIVRGLRREDLRLLRRALSPQEVAREARGKG